MDLKRQKKVVNIFLGLSYLVCFARFIPLCNQIGEEGVGLFAGAFLLYFIYMILMQDVFSEQVARMINGRMRRDQYRNAGQVFDFTLLLGAGLGIVMCCLVFLLAGFFAEKVLLMKHAADTIRYLAPAFAFGTVIAVFSAYLKGVGDHITDALLRLGMELLITLLCILISGSTYLYGTQVGNLLHQDVFSAVYGARGCGIAVSLGAFLMLIAYFLFFLQTKVTFKRRTIRDVSARDEESGAYVRSMFVTPVMTYVAVFLVSLSLLLQERMLFARIAAWNEKNPQQMLNACVVFGRYFGKGIVFVLFPIAMTYAIYHGMAIYIRRSLNQDDRKGVRESLQIRLRKYMAVFLPVALFISVFAKPLMGFVSNGEIANVSGAVSVGALSIFFFGLAYIYSQVCTAMDKKLYIMVVHAAAFIVHLIVLMIGLKACKNPVTAIGIAELVASILMACAYGVLMTMQLDYKHNLLHLIKPLIAGVVSAGIGLLIVMLLNGKAADVLILIIGGIVFTILYLIVMAALHGISKKELSRIPGGEFLIRLFYYR